MTTYSKARQKVFLLLRYDGVRCQVLDVYSSRKAAKIRSDRQAYIDKNKYPLAAYHIIEKSVFGTVVSFDSILEKKLFKDSTKDVIIRQKADKSDLLSKLQEAPRKTKIYQKTTNILVASYSAGNCGGGGGGGTANEIVSMGNGLTCSCLSCRDSFLE